MRWLHDYKKKYKHHYWLWRKIKEDYSVCGEWAVSFDTFVSEMEAEGLMNGVGIVPKDIFLPISRTNYTFCKRRDMNKLKKNTNLFIIMAIADRLGVDYDTAIDKLYDNGKLFWEVYE